TERQRLAQDLTRGTHPNSRGPLHSNGCGPLGTSSRRKETSPTSRPRFGRAPPSCRRRTHASGSALARCHPSGHRTDGDAGLTVLASRLYERPDARSRVTRASPRTRATRATSVPHRGAGPLPLHETFPFGPGGRTHEPALDDEHGRVRVLDDRPAGPARTVAV